MDEVTLFGAALIGAGIAVLGLALVAVWRRATQARTRRRELRRTPAPARPPTPRPAPARPAVAQSRSGPVAPPRGRPPVAVPTPALPRRHPKPPGAVGEALDGETLQLGPVPAWKLPVRAGGKAHGPARPDNAGTARRATALFARAGNGGRNETHASEAPPAASQTGEAASRRPDRRFGWFTPGQ